MKRIFLLASVLFVFLAPSAGAYSILGDPWPDSVVRYHVDARRYEDPVKRAVRHWHRAEVGARFASASREDADVLVVYGGHPCSGAAHFGYPGRLMRTTVILGRGCSRRLIVMAAVHELGHVLGLGHEYARCARMNPGFYPSGTPDRCEPRKLRDWLRKPLLGDDVRGARTIYR